MKATEVLTYTYAKGIDGEMMHEDVTMNIEPHQYASAFVTRHGMAGTVTVEASPWRGEEGDVECVDWAYQGTWRDVGDEPYVVILTAEFTEAET
jgi:hypothetical protein